MVVLAVALLGSSDASASEPTHVTIVVLPGHTSIAALSRVRGMGVGILSAGIGNVPAVQTYIDIGQGTRVPESLYDRPLPQVRFAAGGHTSKARARPSEWRQVVDRAASVPADLTPGLFGETLEEHHVGRRLGLGLGDGGLVLANRRGAVTPGCHKPCPTVAITSADGAELRNMARRLRGKDLLIALAQPPPPVNHGLAIGIAGRGFDGTLTSDSTRMRGYVLDTDIAPTILGRLGIAVPDEMDGEPIHTDGTVDVGYVQVLQERLAVIGPWRWPVIGVSVLGWLVLTALGVGFFRRPGLQVGITVLVTSLVLLPVLLLVCAAIEPSELAERLIVGVGCPALAVLLLWFAPGVRGLALAAATAVLAYGADAVAGSHLTELSLIGPNPIAGVRFYGIGNELEATIAALVPLGTGAALAGWAPRRSQRAAALAFALTALVAIAVFAPGRFGADVGAAIGLAVGAAVSIGVCLGARRWRWAWVIAAPVGVLALLVLADLASAGNAHLTRSVLDAGGLGDVGQVLQRRLELSAHSFGRYAGSPILWIIVAIMVAGVLARRSVRAWFGDREALWAGFAGGLAATVAGTLANDSGALLLMIGVGLCAGLAGVAWATQAERRVPGLWRPVGPIT